jgi:hypothetical protein
MDSQAYQDCLDQRVYQACPAHLDEKAHLDQWDHRHQPI